MRITTLGELAVDGRPVRGERLAAVVRALVDARGRTLTPAVLAEAVWGGAPPDDAAGAVHALIARARRLGLPIAAVPGGYRVSPEDIEPDVVLVQAHVTAARRARDPAEAAGHAAQARSGFPAVPELTDGTVAALFADVAAAQAHAALATGRVAPGLEADLTLLATLTPPHEPSAALLMRLLAAQSRQAEALAVMERLRETLAERYGSDPSPVVAEAHLAVLRGEAASGPGEQPRAAGSGKRLPPSWRRAATAMLGRERDVDALRAALSEAPLVTVVAVGGAGKTRLAAEIARRTAAAGGAVHVVELAGVRAAEAVLPAIVAAADPAPAGTEKIMSAGERLAEVAGLVVLDNCEHLLAGAAGAVAELLDASPDVAVLATSRAPLGLPGEVVHRLATLDDDAALELLTARARAGGARIGAADARQTLCRRLDNLPLALELAAARLRHMPIEDVLAGLDDRFGLLDDALRGLPDRHAGLWAMVDWSRELLGPAERVLLERLAVIPAPFTKEVAEHVAGQHRGLAVRLATLVEQSLLVLEDGHRYRMLETVREYGEARLAAAGGRDAAMDGLVAWARAEAVRLHGEFIGPGQLAAFARCGAEQDNLVAALRWACGRDDAAAVDIAVPLFHLWTVRGRHGEVAPWAAALLRAGDPVARREYPLVRTADPDRLTWLCLLAGVNAFAVDAHRVFALAERVLRRLGRDRPGARVSPRAAALATVVPALGELNLDKGLAAAEALIAQPDPYAQGFGLFLRGVIRENRGDAVPVAERTADAELAYRRFEAAGDHWGMAMAAQMIGSQGGPDGADWLRRGAGHMELLGAAEDAGSIRVMLDAQLAQLGDDAAAERLVEVANAGPVATPVGFQIMEGAQANLGLAHYAWRQGRTGDAVAHAERAAEIAREGAAPVPQVRVVFGTAAAVFNLRAAGAAGGVRAAGFLEAVRAEALSGLDVPSLGVWALGTAALAAHLGDGEAARELWTLGVRCSANPAQLFEPGTDPVLDAAVGRSHQAAQASSGAAEPAGAGLDEPHGPEFGDWRTRPMTEVTGRIRELAEVHLQTLRR
ncbi:BTAD domain-containing putative transcriptional regulator [Dactylosporangium matsuzakiense]|uniref:SARP family transcriptional regulator n=1 Tax=Dactylosporangium matsuzakiense TaxID=53360 RepID=A0A9W6KUX4_9ACTN|nr:BTAD domain-containing putative transcriptional regulator [Dactylosporangium matsuzakiense]GLL07144.1 SARP family transcriptional regulator [Dactylosporangium matsuzakiense]